MMGELALRPSILAVIAGMSIITYVTKASGLWILSKIELSDRIEAGLDVLPGAIIISILGPQLLNAGPPEWMASLIVLVIALRFDNILLPLIGGIGSVLLFRGLL